MAKGSDNVFPKLILVETAAPGSVASGNQAAFIDPVDHLLKLKSSAGVITILESPAERAAALTYAYKTFK